MAGSWQAAKRAVESHFTDKCRVTEFTEEETSWGETRFSAVQGKEVTCRLVEEGDGSDIEGLLAYGQWEGVLLYPTENHIMAGRRQGGRLFYHGRNPFVQYSQRNGSHTEMSLLRG